MRKFVTDFSTCVVRFLFLPCHRDATDQTKTYRTLSLSSILRPFAFLAARFCVGWSQRLFGLYHL